MAGQRPDQYLESFSWDAAKFPPRRALNETVSAITENVQKLEDDLKVKLLHDDCTSGLLDMGSSASVFQTLRTCLPCTCVHHGRLP